MNAVKKVMVFGAAGRVGLGLVNTLLRYPLHIAVADFIPKQQLAAKVARTLVDYRLSTGDSQKTINVYGDVDALNEEAVATLLAKEKPDIVVNYAIPFTGLSQVG